jgi:hypothetical protein
MKKESAREFQGINPKSSANVVDHNFAPVTDEQTNGFVEPCVIFLVFHLTTLSISRLYSVYDRMINECGAVAGAGNRSTHEKPAPVAICPPKMPHNLTWDRNRTAAVGIRPLIPVLL